MLIQQLLGQMNVIKTDAANFESIAMLYNKFALILPDTVMIASKNRIKAPVPLPLIGFEISYNGDIPFIVNEHGEFPYLNRQLLIEGAIRQNADFSVTLHHLITSLNPWKTQMITNQVFVDGIDYYDRMGGTFALLTPWGDINYAVLSGLYGVQNEAGQNGISYRLDLKKLVPVYKNQAGELLDKLSSYITGVII